MSCRSISFSASNASRIGPEDSSFSGSAESAVKTEGEGGRAIGSPGLSVGSG